MANTYAALRTAIKHIEHMAAWIAARKSGYSFESLGEDMPGIKAALAQLDSADTRSAGLTVGNVYESRIGPVVYLGLDHYCSETTHKFEVPGNPRKHYERPANLHQFLSTGLLPDASPGNGAEKVREALEVAYGLLWVVGCDRSTLGGNALYLARKALLEQLDKAGQARGITAARKALNDEDAAHGLRYSLHGYSDPSVRSRSCDGAGDASTGGTSSGSVAAVRDDGNTAGPTRADGLNAALHSTSAAGETRPTIPRGGVEPDWHAESVKLYRQNKALRTALQEQHDWHLAQGDKDFGDGITLNMADEYGDSGMCERTTSILSEVLPSGIQGYEAWKAKRGDAAGETDIVTGAQMDAIESAAIAGKPLTELPSESIPGVQPPGRKS